MKQIIEQVKHLYSLEDCIFTPVSGHEGGRNQIIIVSRNGEKQYVLRISALGDRSENDYLAETEFVRFLAENGAPVADVIPSVRGRLVECVEADDNGTPVECVEPYADGTPVECVKADANGKVVYASLFAYAKGMLIVDNGYRYREGAPLSEYFYNTGKSLGSIHRVSKTYTPVHRRPDYFDKYNMTYLNSLIPDEYGELKKAIAKRLDEFCALPKDEGCYGLVHFDFSDGNYHIDMDTGAITVFDFDNCMNCWYMFDLANLWIHNEGWTRQETDPGKRFALMQQCFDLQLQGYRTETDIPDEMLSKLPMFVNMVLIENIVDEFECAFRDGEELDYEDIEDAAECLINGIP
ncbi:MAG: phosphotransferase [Lachnospiraceae bacterium]|nr:phosphotransferase [Lachnospiraceae bacterium]